MTERNPQAEKMDEHKSIGAALLAAQAEMPKAVINKVNPHFKNRYADLEAVRAAAIPTLTKHGIVVMQAIEMNEVGAHSLVTQFKHVASDNHISSTFPLPDGKPQEIGSAITYARRYSLVAMAGLTSEEDDDGEAASKNTSARRRTIAPKPTGTKDAADELINEITACLSVVELTAWGTAVNAKTAIARLADGEQNRVRQAYGDNLIALKKVA
jgi:hypothetical protein